jgi:hypothetical protein
MPRALMRSVPVFEPPARPKEAGLSVTRTSESTRQAAMDMIRRPQCKDTLHLHSSALRWILGAAMSSIPEGERRSTREKGARRLLSSRTGPR